MLAGAIQKTAVCGELTLELQRTPKRKPRTATLTVRISSLAITNQALRELSGVNGLIVGDWIKSHADEVISHNTKYGMQNAKDPQRLDTYYNKRYVPFVLGRM
jgi:hypothetical protein